MMRETTGRYKAGVTLTELMVVLLIVSLLATLAVPVVINRSAQARVSVARSECEALAHGEDMCGMIHGYYVPLQVLDDIPTVLTARDPIRTDDLLNEDGLSLQLINVNINPSQQVGVQDILDTASSSNTVRQMESDWAGPFVQPQRVFKSGLPPTSQYEQRDYPLDPWGNPYRMYSPIGIVGDTSGTSGIPSTYTQIDTSSFSNGQLTTTDDRFDRFAIVSFGPNGFSDGPNPGVNADDIVYFFGTLVRRNDTFP